LTGSEFSGEILAVPSTGNPKYKVGDKVFGAAQGAYATKVCAEEKVLHPVPEGWSYEDAAGLYVTGMFFLQSSPPLNSISLSFI